MIPIKKILVLMIIFIFILPLSSYGSEESIKVYVNNNLVNFPDQKPYVDSSNRTLVPLKFVSEAIGAEVTWDEYSQSVLIAKGSSRIYLTIDENKIIVDGNEKYMDTKPIVINARTMVPIKFVSEALGASVEWDNSTNAVLINMKNPLDKLSPLESVRLLPDSIVVNIFGTTENKGIAAKGSVIEIDHDGGRYAVVWYQNNIQLYDLEEQRLGPILDTYLGQAVFSISGDYVAWHSRDGDKSIVKLYNISTGTTKEIKYGSNAISYCPKLSPNHQYLSFYSTPGYSDSQIAVIYDLNNDSYKELGETDGDAYMFTWAGDNFIYCAREDVVVIENGYSYRAKTKVYNSLTGTLYNIENKNVNNGQFTWIRGSGDWLVLENESIYLLNLKTNECRCLLNDKNATGNFRYAKVHAPSIDGNWVVWTNRGDFYAYNIKSQETTRLTNYNDPPEDDFDPRYFWRMSFVSGDKVFFYGGTVSLQMMRLPAMK